MTQKNIKCVVVGDAVVGKTCLILRYTHNSFNEDEYVPTVAEAFAIAIVVNQTDVRLTLWDTAGTTDYDRLRPLAYPNTQVFLVCFDVANVSSFNNIQTRWIPEVQHHCPNAAIVIVGTMADKRYNSVYRKNDFVSKSQIEKLMKTIKNCHYIECSASSGAGVKETFSEAIKAVLYTETARKSKKRCVSL